MEARRTRGTLKVKDEDAHKIVLVSTGTMRFWKLRVDYEKTIFLYKDSGKISFETKLTGTGKQYRLTAAFPTTIEGGRLFQEIPFSTVERSSGEFPAQNWAVLEDENGGVLLMNAGIPGNGRLGGTLYLALTRSVSIAYKTDSELAYEEGVSHTYRYEIEPYEGKAFHSLLPWRRGEQLNIPLQTAVYPSGTKLLKLAGIEVEGGDSIHVSGFYKETDKWSIRLYEAGGTAAKGTIRFPGIGYGDPSLSVWEQDAVGEPASEPVAWHGILDVVLRPFQIKTFAIGTRVPEREN